MFIGARRSSTLRSTRSRRTGRARAAILNGRGTGALRKIGAMQEGILRKSFLRNGQYLDQALWTILDEDWKQQRVVSGVRLH